MPSISANLDKISAEIKKIEQNSKMARAETKGLGDMLRFDGNNVDLIIKRFNSLGNELEQENKKIAQLKAKEEELTKISLSGQYKEGSKELEKLNRQLDDTRVKLQYAEDRAKGLAMASSETARNQEIVRAVTANVNAQYEKQERTAKRIQITTLATIMLVRQWTTEAVKQGTELYALSKRYDMSAEEIQEWDRALELATGQSGLFSRSLKELVKTFAEVASGRGIATENVLKDIGLAYKDLAEMSSQEQFHAIIDALQGVENASLRASYAEKLFKEAGIDIAGVFNDNTVSLDEYLERAKEFSVISDESVQRLAELNFDLEEANVHLDVAKAEIVSALLPAIRATADILKVLAPAIQGFGKGLQQLGGFGNFAVIALTGMLLLMPLLVKWSKQHRIEKLLEAQAIKVTGDESLKTAGKMAVLNASLGAVGLVLSGIALVLGLISKKADETTADLNKTINASKGLMAETGTDFTTNTEQYATSNKEYYMQADVNIYGEGDTPIGDENAVKVAQYTADALNKSLGELVK